VPSDFDSAFHCKLQSRSGADLEDTMLQTSALLPELRRAISVMPRGRVQPRVNRRNQQDLYFVAGGGAV
jgi:hypothetical protein